MPLIQLNKIVISIQNNPEKFLSGLTSNDLDKPRNAFLNVHGKIIATFDQIKRSDSEYWIIIEASRFEDLSAHLQRYIALSQVTFERLEKNVYFCLSKETDLGDRAEGEIPQKSGKLIISSETLTAEVSEDEFTLFRLNHNIPLEGVDFQDNFVLNVDEDGLVSYTKGCYLGQEPVSKVHNRSKASWQLTVKDENDCSPEELAKMTSKLSDSETNRTLGFVFTRNTH